MLAVSEVIATCYSKVVQDAVQICFACSFAFLTLCRNEFPFVFSKVLECKGMVGTWRVRRRLDDFVYSTLHERMCEVVALA